MSLVWVITLLFWMTAVTPKPRSYNQVFQQEATNYAWAKLFCQTRRQVDCPFIFKTMQAFKPLNGLMLLMFLFSLAVQYNDPDPGLWMFIYGMAALACGVAWRWPRHWQLSAGLCFVALLWAGTLSKHVLGNVAFGELFAAWEMKDVRVEEGREMGGLLIVAGWMFVLFLRARRLRLTQR